MHKLSCIILSSLAITHAQNLDRPPQLRYLRRDTPFLNNTITTTTIATQAEITTTSTFVNSTASTTPLTTDPPANWEPYRGSIPTSSPQGFPPPYPNASTTDPTCIGFATYFESVPPTVFLTVTEGFDVTVTATNVSVTVSETLITPLPPCGTTIMSSALRSQTVQDAPEGAPEGAPFTKSAKGSQPQPFGSRTQNQPEFATYPAVGPPGGPPQEQSSTVTDNLAHPSASLVYSTVPYTSTVIVTKKTPITVVVPPTTSPGVNFQPPESTLNGAQNTAPPPPEVTSDPGTGKPNNNNAPPSGPRTTNSNNPSLNTERRTSSTGIGLGDIINSIIFSGLPRPTGGPTRSTTVNGVPIVILTSTVVIGGQSFAVPTSARTSIQVNGVGFELGPSEIVAPSTTITIAPQQQGQVITITPRPTATTVAVGDGLTLTVGQTVAVIAGTTYRVGQGAPATTITIDGATISVGSNGVALPATIVSPVGASASGYVVYTVNDFTFSVDDNEAVLSSTTYRIGSNAPQMTTVVGGETISFGPNGIGLHSTTIAPTAVPSGSATTGARSGPSASATGGATNKNTAAPVRLRIPFSELLGWYLIASCAVYNLLF